MRTIALIALACSAEPSPPRVVAEPRPEPAREEPPPPEVDEPVDPGRRVRVVVLPANDVELPTPMPSSQIMYADAYGEEGMYEPGSWPRLEPTDPSFAWLTQAIRDETDAFVAELRCSGDCGEPYGAGCSIELTTPELVSLDCGGYEMPGRGYPQRVAQGRLYAIDGERLVRFALRDALLPDSPLHTQIRASCVRQGQAAQTGRPHEDFDSPLRRCRDAPDDAALVIHRSFVRAHFPCADTEYGALCHADIQFRALDRKILADSPFGRALLALAGVTSEEVTLPPEAILAGEERGGFARSPQAPLEQTLARWAALAPADREGVIIAAGATGTMLASQAATANSHPVSWREELVPFVGRTRAQLNLRDDHGFIHMVVPAGTIVSAVRGRVGSRESRIGERNTWVYLLASPRIDAWGAGNLVEEHTGCMPSPDRFIAELPATNRERAARTLVTMLIDLPGREPRPAVAFASVLRYRSGERSGRVRVGIYERDASCALGRRLHRVDLDGRFFGLGVTSTEAGRGETLIAIGTGHWHVFRLGNSAPLITVPHHSDDIVFGLREGGAYYPIAWRSDDPAENVRVRWTGTALTAAPE